MNLRPRQRRLGGGLGLALRPRRLPVKKPTSAGNGIGGAEGEVGFPYRQGRVDVGMGGAASGAVTTAKGADYFPGGNHAALPTPDWWNCGGAPRCKR